MNKSTKIYHLAAMTEEQKKSVADALKQGATAIIPTDTVYGAVTAAVGPQSLELLNNFKNNPQSKPTQILCTLKQAFNLSVLDKRLEALAVNYWPGGLTVITDASLYGAALQGGLKTAGLRVPNFAFAQFIMDYNDCPLFASSANMHGMPVCDDEETVISEFDGSADIIVLYGDIKKGASAVIDITGGGFKIIRQGKITKEDLQKII